MCDFGSKDSIQLYTCVKLKMIIIILFLQIKFKDDGEI